MSTLRAALRAIQAVREEANDVRDYAEHLAPGLWVAVPPTKQVWHHVDANLPPTLLGASGKATVVAQRGNRDFDSRRQWAKHTAFRTVLRLAGARRQRVIVPSVGEGQGNATVLVQVQGDRAELVALSPGEQAVRVGRAASFDEEYVDVRRRFERYVPAPSFSVSEDGAVLVEQWCDGPLLSQLPVAQRLPHTLTVLEGYAQLVTAEAVTDDGSMWRQLPALIEQDTLPTWLAEQLADRRVRQLLSTPLLIPSQGDCWAANIVVGDEGSTARVIDFDWAGWHPVWFDLAKLSTVFDCDGNRVPDLAAAIESTLGVCGVEGVAELDDSHWAALYGVGWAWRQTQLGWSSDGAAQVDFQQFVRIAGKRASEWHRLASSAGQTEPPTANTTRRIE